MTLINCNQIGKDSILQFSTLPARQVIGRRGVMAWPTIYEWLLHPTSSQDTSRRRPQRHPRSWGFYYIELTVADIRQVGAQLHSASPPQHFGLGHPGGFQLVANHKTLLCRSILALPPRPPVNLLQHHQFCLESISCPPSSLSSIRMAISAMHSLEIYPGTTCNPMAG